MSVLIKGMEMLKDGVYWCEIGVADDIAMITIHGEDRKSFPLVSVPPHGRLGDLDVLFEFVESKYKVAKGEARKAYSDVLDFICAAGDIIEAEEGKI